MGPPRAAALISDFVDERMIIRLSGRGKQTKANSGAALSTKETTIDTHAIDTSRTRAKARLESTGFAFGTMISAVWNPLLVKMAADAGYDFVYIDMEHSAVSWEVVATDSQMANAYGVTPIVRLDHWDRDSVGKALDLGAQGVLFHDVETVAQANDIIAWTSGSKAAGRSGDAHSARRRLTIVVQIESAAGVDAADAILRTGVADVVEIGRGDLAMSLGHPLERDHPTVLAAVDEVVATCRKHDVTPGMACTKLDDTELSENIDRGIRWIMFGTDRHLLIHALNRGMAMFRSKVGSPASSR
jgi:4-hydroxy-2-oxoheptanedioate aldolase